MAGSILTGQPAYNSVTSFIGNGAASSGYNQPNTSNALASGLTATNSSGTGSVPFSGTRTDANPQTGQAASTPPSAPDPNTFSIDTYRNGSGNGNSETNWMRELSDYDPSGSDNDTGLIFLTVPDGSQTIIDAYSRFFLQSVTEAEQEKYQIVETFTAFYTFFYGKRPPIYRFTGVLLSDPIYRWNNDFKFVYENYLRGTSAVELGAEVRISYDERLVIGYPLGLTMNQAADNPKGVQFALDMLVIEHITQSYSTDIAALLNAKRAELASQRAAIQAAIAQLSTNVPSAQTQISRQVTSGKRKASTLQAAGENPSQAAPVPQNQTPPQIALNNIKGTSTASAVPAANVGGTN